MRWGIAYLQRKDRQEWTAGSGRGRSWLAILDADSEGGATMMYRLQSGDTKPVIAVPLDQKAAA